MEKKYTLTITEDGKNTRLVGNNQGFNSAEIIGHLQTAIYACIIENKPKRTKVPKTKSND